MSISIFSVHIFVCLANLCIFLEVPIFSVLKSYFAAVIYSRRCIWKQQVLSKHFAEEIIGKIYRTKAVCLAINRPFYLL